ncbi:putative membrane protein [Hyphomonas neptunium ATCC 15444]|uniref:Putative membrane protein n=1 Tax=Hyphomonas neptunium (strain ATCC 15444) TaxID=228405 RepID=Q0C417_HYPNA|nr:putative membrane protein [Hyphomonas neptunium ATCC 15444]
MRSRLSTDHFMMICGFGIIVCIFGALPGVMAPTMGQAIWLTGFSSAFANDFPISLYATDFGYPLSSPIPFGLSGALPCAILIKMGVPQIDAYSLVFAAWLLVAYYFAIQLAKYLGVNPKLAVLLALTWCTMPILWTHVPYSMLSIGMVLMPTYAYAAIKFIQSNEFKLSDYAFLFFICIIAVFTDGYTFVMFAILYGGVSFGEIVLNRENRRKSLLVFTPLAMVAFAMSYVLYTQYIGQGSYPPPKMEFFRAWGADLTYFLQPTANVTWLWDILNLSADRPDNLHYGDASAHRGTFLLPLILISSFAVARLHRSSLKCGLLIVAAFSLYMSLGPTFKIGATRAEDESRLMHAEAAGTPTGTQVLSERVPGFKNMRASYRWVVLTQLSLWIIVTLWLGNEQRTATNRSKVSMQYYFIPLLLILVQLPNPIKAMHDYSQARHQFNTFAEDTSFFRKELEGQLVAFLPYGNDFGVNFLASTNGFQSFNIGGDKNWEEAKKVWPQSLHVASRTIFSSSAPDNLTALFSSTNIDAVVVLQHDLLWSVHSWPPALSRIKEINTLRTLLMADDAFLVSEIPRGIVIRRISKTEAAQMTACPQEVCARLNIRPDMGFGTMVGQFDMDGVTTTTGVSGYLLFGPYINIEAGQYTAEISFAADQAATVHVDVVSDLGKSVHAEKRIVISASESGNLIGSIDFTLLDSVKDLEVRIRVDENTTIRATSLTIRPGK